MSKFTSKKNFSLILVVFIGVMTLISNKALASSEDVPMNHWARDSVKEISGEYQFMKGDPNGSFRGNSSVSRYELAVTLSRMLKYMNAELDSGKEDMASVVSVMELFQNELKVLEERNKEMSLKLQEFDTSINELNYLISEIKSGTPEEKTELISRIENAEALAKRANEKGLFFDTLIMGPVNDVKHLGQAVSGSKSEKELVIETEVKSELVQENPETESEENVEDDNSFFIEEIETNETN